jgi:hypothetical protein
LLVEYNRGEGTGSSVWATCREKSALWKAVAHFQPLSAFMLNATIKYSFGVGVCASVLTINRLFLIVFVDLSGVVWFEGASLYSGWNG